MANTIIEVLAFLGIRIGVSLIAAIICSLLLGVSYVKHVGKTRDKNAAGMVTILMCVLLFMIYFSISLAV